MFTPAPVRRQNAPLTTASKSSRKLPGPLGETTAKKQRTGAAAEPDAESVVDEFACGPWQCMLRAVLRQPSRDNTAAPFAHSIRSICKKAYLKPVPQLAVILKSIAAAEWGDALVTVRDPTGEMQGTLHHKVLEEDPKALAVGCVLLLRDVSIYSPTHKLHYLNITSRNVIHVYPAHSQIPLDSSVYSNTGMYASQRQQGAQADQRMSQVPSQQWRVDDEVVPLSSQRPPLPLTDVSAISQALQLSQRSSPPDSGASSVIRSIENQRAASARQASLPAFSQRSGPFSQIAPNPFAKKAAPTTTLTTTSTSTTTTTSAPSVVTVIEDDFLSSIPDELFFAAPSPKSQPAPVARVQPRAIDSDDDLFD